MSKARRTHHTTRADPLRPLPATGTAEFSWSACSWSSSLHLYLSVILVTFHPSFEKWEYTFLTVYSLDLGPQFVQFFLKEVSHLSISSIYCPIFLSL